MTSTPAEPDSLDQLQSPEQIALLDAIDKLRYQGLSHYNISLPQLIVCGDQSSGKSSVLEGLTRLRFPTKDGLCTTFATELVLRKNPITKIVCSILPGKDRSQAEKDELLKFKRTFSSRDDFTFDTLLEEARAQMTFRAKSDQGPFFKDVLQISYSGPELPSLTIVDLPGIIQSQVEGQRGVTTVRNLVQGYMKDEKSIILAVVSARNDLENQGVLDYVKQHDPDARRTLGIITKPDTLDVGSESESRFVRLAKNEIMSLSLGWHAVKNRGFGMGEQSDTERDEAERQFFASGIWTSLPRANVGIETLRAKLSRVLLQHIREELPSLSAGIKEAIEKTEYKLKGLGNPRDEQQQQRNYLMEKAQRFQSLTLDALRGIYEDPFFKGKSLDSILASRLRTGVQNLNIAFAYAMYRKGHQWQIDDDPYLATSGFPSHHSIAIHNYDALPDPIRISRAEFEEEQIGTQVRLSRRSGLTSIVNPWVIGEIFRQQAQPWEAIARRHLIDVVHAVAVYLHESLSQMMDSETFNALMQEHIEPELEARLNRLEKKLKELLIPFQKQEPIIYSPGFVNDLAHIRMERDAATDPQSSSGKPQQNVAQQQAPTQLLTEGMDGYTNTDICDHMHSYYKNTISVFISNITVLAIENCLITDLPSLLDPPLVLNMDEEKLALIASESEEIRIERAALSQKLEDLNIGKRILDSHARKSGKAIRTSLRPRKTSSTPTPQVHSPRPRTPNMRPAAQANKEQATVDDLTSGFNSIHVTPPPATEAKARSPLLQPRQTPLTPPKSPRPTPKAAPKWKMRADDWRDDSDEEL